MMQAWSWGLTALGVAAMYLAGRRSPWGWAIGIAAQLLWLAYSITTQQWGFLLSCFLYGGIYIRNFRAWRRPATPSHDELPNSTPPERTPVMNTVTVNGYTGDETDEDTARLYNAKLLEIREQYADDPRAGSRAFTAWLDHHYASLGAARYHNRLIAPTRQYETARRVAAARTREAEEAYRELTNRTTTAWHAAHHRFVLAATTARAALADVAEQAGALHAAHAVGIKYVTLDLYKEMVPAADRVASVMPDLGDLRAELDAFVELYRQRFETTAHTIAGTTPVGFEPPQEPEPATADDACGYSYR